MGLFNYNIAVLLLDCSALPKYLMAAREKEGREANSRMQVLQLLWTALHCTALKEVGNKGNFSTQHSKMCSVVQISAVQCSELQGRGVQYSTV